MAVLVFFFGQEEGGSYSPHKVGTNATAGVCLLPEQAWRLLPVDGVEKGGSQPVEQLTANV